MVELIRRWSVVIMVAGVLIFNWGFDNESSLLTVLGVIIALVGLVFLVYQRWFNLGWLVAVVGISMVALGLADESSVLGNPIETPNVLLAVIGAIIAVGGLAFFAFSYSAYRRTPHSGQALQNSQ